MAVLPVVPVDLIDLPELLANILVLLQVPLLVVPLLIGAILVSLVKSWRVLLPLLLKDPVMEAMSIPAPDVRLSVLLMSLPVVLVLIPVCLCRCPVRLVEHREVLCLLKRPIMLLDSRELMRHTDFPLRPMEN